MLLPNTKVHMYLLGRTVYTIMKLSKYTFLSCDVLKNVSKVTKKKSIKLKFIIVRLLRPSQYINSYYDFHDSDGRGLDTYFKFHVMNIISKNAVIDPRFLQLVVLSTLLKFPFQS